MEAKVYLLPFATICCHKSLKKQREMNKNEKKLGYANIKFNRYTEEIKPYRRTLRS